MKHLLIALFACVTFTAIAQEPPKRTPLRVFATYEDMLADRPVEGSELMPTQPQSGDWWLALMNDEWVYVNEGGQRTKKEVKDLPYWGLTNEYGNVIRVYEGHLYLCYALGKKCVYWRMNWANPKEWMSDGPSAEIQGGKNLVKETIEAAGLGEEYKKSKPKREMKDDVADYAAKERRVMITFMDRINGDSAVK
jgi:hypothetical protein